MLELIISIVASIVLYIISIFVNISNTIAGNILGTISIAIPTVLLWKNTPKNYLKLMSLKSMNIKFDLSIKLNGCILDEDKYKLVEYKLRDFDKSSKGKIIKQSLDKLLYISVIEVDTTLLELEYSSEEEVMFIRIKDKIKYKLFFNLSEKLLHEIFLIFKDKDMSFEESEISLKIDFKCDNQDDECKNPFWKKLLDGFNNKIVSFKYIAKNNSLVEISNHRIEFYSKNLLDINRDIKKELKFITIRN